jgi:hypothetical protein
LRWLLLLEAGDLMLDVLAGFLALYFVDVVGASPAGAGAAVMVWTGVGLLGDFLLIPLLERVRGLRYLRASACTVLLVFPLFMLAQGWAWKLCLVGLLGFCNAGWYAILQARLYAALPGQSGTAWENELARALSFGTGHLSLYQLTIEPGTWFERLQAAGHLAVPSPDEGRALWDVTQETCEAAGLPAYEISNHARPGAESRHNLVYWRYGEYAGVGPGAHGRLVTPRGRLATATEKRPEAWLALVEEAGHGTVTDELLSSEAEGDEFLVMGLRLKEGIDPRRYTAFTGRVLDERRLRDLEGDGLIARLSGERLLVTREGFPVLDAVVADLAA